MQKLIVPLLALATLAGAGADASAKAPHTTFKGQALARDAKVTLAEAPAIALKARPGAITDQELEKERGGSGLRYSFDVKAGKATYEVGVDARSGRVLENAREGKNPD